MRHSLRFKIQVGYFILLIPLLISLSLSYFGLCSIWQRIQILELMDNFRENILEARRFEKNFLLYRHREDIARARDFADKALDILKEHKQSFLKISNKHLVHQLKSNLLQYRADLQKFSTEEPGKLDQQEEKKLRKVGKELVDLSNVIREKEVQLIDRTFQGIVYYLFILAVISIGIIIAVGYLMSQTVVRPLEQLEKCMRDLAQGKNLEPPCPKSKDKEIASVIKTLYLMLDELEARKEQLVQSKKLAALGTLLSGVAHELNNPLSNASSSCQILLEDLDDLDKNLLRAMLKQIDGEIWRARDIVRTLLEFSRHRHYEPRTWPLSQLVEEVLVMTRGKLSPGVRIDLKIPPDLKIYVDKQRFQQALLNLVSNAIDAVGEEGRIVIGAQEDADRYGVLIIVQDNGCGIPPEIQDKIFDPFFSTKGTKGSGLGLYLVNEIVARHGGSITLKSDPGKGTSFYLFFPHKRGDESGE
jgi:signal transduction histidine kinase